MSVSLCLASASPRRIEMLRRAGVPHAVFPVDIDETPLPHESAEALVRRLSQQKAAAARSRSPQFSAFLGADTIVAGRQDDGSECLLGKPAHIGQARQMLRMLSGRSHRVVTGYHLDYVEPDGTLRSLQDAVSTEVVVRTLSDEELDAYLRSEEWRGKAGAYAIQGHFGCFVSALHGSYDSVVGLPLCEVLSALRVARLLPSPWPSWQAA